MTDYSLAEGSPELAAIRAQAQAIRERALQGDVTTKSGSFHLGKGYSIGSNAAFLDEYKAQVEKGASGSSITYGLTGNIKRTDTPIAQFIAGLEHNKKNPSQAQDLAPLVLPKSYYQEIIGNPADLTPQGLATSARNLVQAPASLQSIAPRVDSIDLLAPTILPSLNPPSFIPSDLAPNNLIDANAELDVLDYSDNTSQGDTYIPEVTEEEGGDAYQEDTSQAGDPSQQTFAGQDIGYLLGE